MAEKKITVKIAKRTYPLTIDSAEESKVLGAVQLINDNIFIKVYYENIKLNNSLKHIEEENSRIK